MTPRMPGVRIDGQARPGSAGPLIVTNPATEEPTFEVATGGRDDALAAFASSADVFPAWAATLVCERASLLREIARHLRCVAETGDLAATTTRETGKRVAESRAEIRFSADYFEYYADVIGTEGEASWDVVPGTRHLVRSRPKGVVAVLSPWNFPISVPARKIAPALAAGCTVVFKPSELTPVSSLAFAAIVDQYLPGGVVNTVVGLPEAVSQPWLEECPVRAVTFTGSPRVGRLLGRSCGGRLQDLILELGGRAPFIVAPDVDIDTAADLAMVAKYRNNGQSCIAANNIWVHESIWDAFIDAFLDRSMALRVGDPIDDATDLGPVRRADDIGRLRDLIQRSDSMSVKSGSVPIGLHGSFLPPTVCLQPQVDSELWQEEIFGPVAALRPYREAQEIISDVNNSEYALGGYVCSADVPWAFDLAARLDIEIVGVNVATPNIPHVPFGGSKASGLGGYEGSLQGLEAFRQHQSTAISPMKRRPFATSSGKASTHE